LTKCPKKCYFTLTIVLKHKNMRSLRFLTINILFLLVCSIFVFSLKTEKANAFTDVDPEIWYAKYVEDGVRRGYLDDGLFYRPGDYLNRAELANIVARAFYDKTYIPSGELFFQDVPKGIWFWNPIKILFDDNVINGYMTEDGVLTGFFGPGDLVTREQAAKIIALGAKLKILSGEKQYFYDFNESSQLYDYAMTLYSYNILDGYDDRTFRAKNYINRAEIAKILSTTIDFISDTNIQISLDGITRPDPITDPTTDPNSTTNPDPITAPDTTTPPDPTTDPTSSPTVIPTADAAFDEIITYFESLRTETVFPVQGKTINDVEAPFGPRVKNSTVSYDWHRGIDIDATLGTPLLAVTDGEFLKIDNYQSGGNTVILKHEFTNPVNYNGSTLQYYYTFYMHLDSIVPELVQADANNEHPAITKGDVIGYVGHSGADVDHLHFELRVGTYCSLEYQLANQSSSCANGFLFDPHINPMYFFEPLTPNMNLALTSGDGINTDLQIEFTSDENQPLLNRVEYQLVNNSGDVLQSHILDFNQRLGYDASTTAALDTQDIQNPYISPLTFTDSSSIFTTNIVVPASYAQESVGDYSVVFAEDIWGNRVELVIAH
jgi:murein DD-endopeptidase MepM/ murein hydrolase activator NlpD